MTEVRDNISDIKFVKYTASKHTNGQYDTCPLHGPKKFMPNRRVEIRDGCVWLLDNPKMTWNVGFFFDVNLIVERT